LLVVHLVPAQSQTSLPKVGTVLIGTGDRLSRLTAWQDESGGVNPRIVFFDNMDEVQEHLPPKTSTSGVVIGGAGRRDKPTGEYIADPAI
jgi:hypothetical protein